MLAGLAQGQGRGPSTEHVAQVTTPATNPTAFQADVQADVQAAVQAVTEITSAISSPWRFHPGQGGDGFAEPGFDDSGWAVAAPDELLSAAHLSPAATDGWARMRLRAQGNRGGLGLTIETRSGQQYVVYANGTLIGASAGALEGYQQRSRPFVMRLPGADDLVIAVHLLPRKTMVDPRFPISAVHAGPFAAMTEALELDRLRTFDGEWLTAAFAGLVYFSLVPIALTLFFARRDRGEYLWLAIFCLVGSAYMFFSVADGGGELRETLANRILYIYSGWGTLLTGLEFVGVFAGARRKMPIRIFQCFLLAGPSIFFLHRYAAYNVTLAAALVVWMAMVTGYLVAAYRRGQAESGLLLVPFALIPLFTLIGVLATFYPRVFPLTRRTRIGHIGVGLDDLASVLFICGILAIVLYRFVRVSRDEQLAAAELEAARTVQQVLIPTSDSLDVPSVAGYRIASVYHPARVVGGDFFQVIAGKDGALVVLGDVSGKGLQAAMTVAVIVGGIRTLAESTQSPAEVLRGLNRLLIGRGTGFTTCIILCLEGAGRVTAANAGHLPPYLNGDELMLPPALPLGVAGEVDYEDIPFRLEEGARLTLLTDGVVEAAKPGTRELFGFERTRNLSMQPAAYIADAARAFGPADHQDDDITVLTIVRALS